MITDSYAVHAHLVRHLYRHGGQAFLFTVLNAAVLALLIAGEVEALPLSAWFSVCVTGAAYHWRTAARHLSLAEKGVAYHNAVRLAFAGAVAGLGFGAAMAFFPALSPSGRFVVLAMLCAQAAAGLPRLSALPLAYAAHLAGVLVPANRIGPPPSCRPPRPPFAVIRRSTTRAAVDHRPLRAVHTNAFKGKGV